MTNYDPTTNPGDMRRRTRFIQIRVPHDGPPTVDVHEEDVIRTATGEMTIGGYNTLNTGVFDITEEFELRDPNTDAIIGGKADVAQAFTLIYSWVRHKQALRDAAANNVVAPVNPAV